MLNIQNYSISKKLTWMNMLVSGVALLLACAAFFAYDLYSFSSRHRAQSIHRGPDYRIEYGFGTRVQRSSCRRRTRCPH